MEALQKVQQQQQQDGAVAASEPRKQQQENAQPTRKRGRPSAGGVNNSGWKLLQARIPATCGTAISELKQEMGLRSIGQTIHWLIQQVRPELLPATGYPLNASFGKSRVIPKTPCMTPPSLLLPTDKGPPAVRRNRLCATVVQAATVFFNTPATLDKAERMVARAAAYGSKLVVFPEAFVGGYPRCVVFDATRGHPSGTTDNDDYRRYYAAAIDVPGPEVDRLARIACNYKVHLVMGVVERSAARSALFSTVLFFDSAGRNIGRQRKRTLIRSEAVVWYPGEEAVVSLYQTSVGKIGGLISWDNRVLLWRSELYAEGVEIYCTPTADAGEMWEQSMTCIAVEGGCFVLSANQFCRRGDCPLPSGDPINGEILFDANAIVSAGGSVIVSPTGTILAGPNYQGECLISADLDLEATKGANITSFEGSRDNEVVNHGG